MKYVIADGQYLETVMELRLEMLRVVNGLDENAVFDKDFVNISEQYFKSGHQTTVLALDNEAVGCASICYISLMPTFHHPTGKRAHIMNVYTRESHRRQGIAQKMVQMLIDDARAHGATEISLDATEAGRPLYEKCGFVKTQEGMVLNLR